MNRQPRVRRGAQANIISAVKQEDDEAMAGTSRPTRQRRAVAKILENFKLEDDDDVVTDAASEADEEADDLVDEIVQDDDDDLVEAVGEDDAEEGSDEEDTSEDGSEEGTYFIDQTGNYYYQATPDSEPILTTPPKGKYVPDDEGKQGEEAGVSYVLVVDEDGIESQVPIKAEKKPSIYHIGDGNNIMIEEEDETDDLIQDEVDIISEPTKVLKMPHAQRGRPSKKMETTEDGTEWACPYCSYVTAKKHLLSRHIKCHNEERPHKCLVCERGFKTMASLQNHVNTHTGNKPHQCKHCDSVFTTSGELVRHVRYKHTLEKPHKCPDCDYASVELSKLRRHIRCHTGERPFQCPHCTYASPDTFKLKRHLRTHTGEKPYQCDTCQARFTQSNSLKAHKMIHNLGDKPVFQCEHCPTTCGRKTDLRIHIQKLHSTDVPYPCKKCSETFPDRYTYKQHIKTHDGEKCYKCTYCEYRAMSERHLESHILIHTSEKPYRCPDCDQSFRQKQLLKRHVNLHHNPLYVPPEPKDKNHSCPTCGKGFHHKGNLVRHMMVHDPASMAQEEASPSKRGRKVKEEAGEVRAFDFSEGEEELEDELEEDEYEEGEEPVDEEIEYAEEELVDNEEDVDEKPFVVMEVVNNDGDEMEMDV